jgi:hypothetical protein
LDDIGHCRGLIKERTKEEEEKEEKEIYICKE